MINAAAAGSTFVAGARRARLAAIPIVLPRSHNGHPRSAPARRSSKST
jgi:hypothetical protein